jgi:hypothetical protein
MTAIATACPGIQRRKRNMDRWVSLTITSIPLKLGLVCKQILKLLLVILCFADRNLQVSLGSAYSQHVCQLLSTGFTTPPKATV